MEEEMSGVKLNEIQSAGYLHTLNCNLGSSLGLADRLADVYIKPLLRRHLLNIFQYSDFVFSLVAIFVQLRQ
jgi:hypothetical protein